MTIRSLSIELDLDAGKFTASMSSATGETLKFQKAVDSTGESLKKIEQAVTSPMAKLRDFTLIFAGMRDAISTVDDLFVGWAANMVKSASQIERTSKMLSGMSDAMDELGKKRDAQTQLDYIINLAKTAPFSLQHLSDAFVKLKSAGLDPMDGTLRGIVEAVARFGGSDQQLERAALAIQQMAGKGVVSMEELRRQLGEAVPTAINMMAAGMGMSYATLIKNIQNGTVESKSAIDKMVTMFNLAYGGSAQAMMDTYAGKLSRLKTSWMEFSNVVVGQKLDGSTVKGGFYDEIKQGIDAITKAMDDPNVKNFGVQIGDELTGATAAAVNLIKGLSGFVQVVPIITIVKDALIALATVMAVDLAISAKNAVVSGFASMSKAFSAGGTALKAMSAEIMAAEALWMEATTILEKWKISVMAGVDAMKLFGAASVNLIPVLGQIGFVIYTVADAFGLFTDKAAAAKKAMDDFNHSGVATEAGVKAANDLKEQAARVLAAAKANLASGLMPDEAYATGTRPMTADERRDAQKQYDAALADYNKYVDDYNKISAAFVEQQTQSAGKVNADAAIRKAGIAELQSEIQKANNDLNKFGVDHKNDPDADAQIQEQKTQIAAKIKQLGDTITSRYQAIIDKDNEGLADLKRQGKEGTDAYKTLLAERDAVIKAASDRMYGKMADILNAPNGSVNGKKKSASEDLLSQLQQRAAQLEAQLGGTYGELAKVQEAIKSDPTFQKATEDQKQALLAAAKRIDDLHAQAEGKTAYDSLTQSLSKQKDAAAELKDQYDALAGSTDANSQSNAIFDANIDKTAKKALAYKNDLGDLVQQIKSAHAEATNFEDANKQMSKLDSDIVGYNSQTTSIFDQLTGGSDQLNKEYESYKRQIDVIVQKIISEVGGDQKSIQEALDRGNEAVTAFAQAQAGQAAMDMVKQAKSINIDLVQDNAEKARQATQDAIQEMNNRVEWDKLTAAQREQVEADYWEFVKAQTAKGAQAAKGPLELMADQWELLGQNMQQAATGWVSDFVDGLAQGTLSFKDFLKEILTGIAKIILQAVIARAVLAGLGALGLLGAQQNPLSLAMPSIDTSVDTGFIGTQIPTLHTGGVVGVDRGLASMLANPSWFSGAPRYHDGGVAGLRPGEIPAILKRGEGVFTEAQMKALGSNGQAVPDVQVNVINQSGVAMSAQKQGQRLDAKALIVDVVVDALSKPGKMRDAVGGVLSK